MTAATDGGGGGEEAGASAAAFAEMQVCAVPGVVVPGIVVPGVVIPVSRARSLSRLRSVPASDAASDISASVSSSAVGQPDEPDEPLEVLRPANSAIIKSSSSGQDSGRLPPFMKMYDIICHAILAFSSY